MDEKRIISNEEYYNLLKNQLPELMDESKKDNNNLKILGSYCKTKTDKNGVKVYADFQRVSDSLEKSKNIKTFAKA